MQKHCSRPFNALMKMPKLDLPERYRRQLLSLLEKYVPEAEVWAYGSRVRGTNHEASDLDIVLRGPQLAKLGYEYFELVEAVRESTIPILIDIFDWARLPESFHREIERNYVVLKESRPWREPQIVDERGRPAAIDIDPADRKTVLQLVERHVPGCEVRAYGPRVEWTAELYSRLDIAVMGTSDVGPRSLTALREAFSNSDLPFIVGVTDWNSIPKGRYREFSRKHVVLQEGHQIRLGDVAEVIMGQSPSGDTVSRDNGCPLLNGPTEFGTYNPSPVQYTTDPRRFGKKGDILFCVRGSTTGRMNWADQDYAIGRGIAAIRLKGTPHLQHFLRGAIEYHLPALLNQATGSTFPNVSRDQLRNLPFPDLPIETQEHVSSALKALDDRIELNRRMCATLEEMASALFKAWFVDFEPVRAKIEGRWREGESLPGLPPHLYDLFPDNLVDSELDPIPTGWRTGCLDEIADHLRETIDPSRSPAQEYALYSIPSFDSGRSPEFTQGRAILSNKCIVYPSTVLMSRLNPDIERVWLIGAEIGEPAIASTEFAVLRPKSPIDAAFLYCSLRSERYRSALVGLVTGTSKSHQRVRPQALAATTLLIPDGRILAEFSRVASQWLGQVLILHSVSQSLIMIRDTLLPKLISGEVRLPGAVEVIEC